MWTWPPDRSLLPALDPHTTFADFVAHITQTIQTEPEAAWVFVTDQLNTHQSEALVRLVAEQCGLQEDLGENSQKRSSRQHEYARRLSLRHAPSHSLRVHSQAQLLAQPN